MRDLLKSEFAVMEQTVEKVDWENPAVYANYLAQAFYYVKYSTRLLGLAGSRFELTDEALHNRFMKHAGEEKSHHILALKDLERLGFKLDQFPELSGTTFLYQPQFFKVTYSDPACFLGYVLALEGGADLKADYMYKRVTAAHGPQKSTFLRTHASVDHDHVKKAFDIVEGLSAERQTLIKVNMLQSIRALEVLFQQLANYNAKSLKVA